MDEGDVMFTQEIYIHGLGFFNVYTALSIQLAGALLCGAFVGIDREARHKSAGLRTNILISVGAMLYTSISLLNMSGETIGGPVDPNRVMAQIVSGIGFLGAGAIIQSKGNVVGLTTAASIWIVAALGAACGSGYILEAIIFSILVVLVLRNSKLILKILPNYSRKRLYSLQLLSIGEVLENLEANLEISRYDIREKTSKIVDKTRSLFVTNIVINDTSKNLIRISKKCRRIVQVDKVSFVHYRGNDLESYDDDDDGES